MASKVNRYFVGDFETTVYEGQAYTEVWASCVGELFTDNVQVFHTIEDTFKYLTDIGKDIIIYYHNLKFDGSFWLNFLAQSDKYRQAVEKIGDNDFDVKFLAKEKMPSKTYKYSISDMGQWYQIIIKYDHKHYIEIRDSYKLLPFSVKKIGKSFQTKHQKTEIEYEGIRYAGCEITQEEEDYIKNDVYVIKEAMEIMFSEGHKSITIGSCCLSEYQNIISKQVYYNLFPNLYEIDIDSKHEALSAGEWIRNSYRGGWCYLVKGKEGVYGKGITADVNSLYPSVMSSESGNEYPFGIPHFWYGNYIPEEANRMHRYYFIRIKTRFKVKEGYLPFIQVKNSLYYSINECLETSDIYDRKTNRYFSRYKDEFGTHDTRLELTLTMTDYKLILEHYDLYEFEIIDGCWFDSFLGLFDDYINRYRKIKIQSTGAKRELAKLFLNNLYGKMATNVNSSYKVAYLKPDKSLGFYTVSEFEKKPGYIAVGSAVTSYARNFTIRAAQKNYHGRDKPGFIYADTDSIHCDLSPGELIDIPVHDTAFCHWKLESTWDKGIFIRQKTYIEHVTENDLKPVVPYYNLKCAGMPERCKQLFLWSVFQDYSEDEYNKLDEAEQEFVRAKRELSDFNFGLSIPGKLLPVQICGGVVLMKTTYEMIKRR